MKLNNKAFKNKIMSVLICISLVFTYLLMPLNSIAVRAEGEERLDVPFFRQIWEPWGKQYLGFSGNLVENSGCALTSLAMVLKYYGVDTDPERLNNWLKENSGYIGTSSIIWSNAVQLGNGTINYLGIVNYPDGANLESINLLLDSGCPVIARMDFQNTDHYVVITGRSGDTYYINDPWYENPARTINESYLPLNNPVQAIKGIVVITSQNSVPPRVPVQRVQSVFPEGQMTMIHPVKNPEISLKTDDPFMYVNGVKKEIDPKIGTKPLIYKDRTLLPLRAVMEEFGGKITWDDSNKKVTIEVQGRIIELWVGRRTFFINGWEFALDAEPLIINGRTMLPLRFIMEKIGCNVLWNGDTRTITIPQN